MEINYDIIIDLEKFEQCIENFKKKHLFSIRIWSHKFQFFGPDEYPQNANLQVVSTTFPITVSWKTLYGNC